MRNALSVAERFMLERGDATDRILRMIDQMSDWRSVFIDAGVSKADIDFCGRYILEPASLVGLEKEVALGRARKVVQQSGVAPAGPALRSGER